jgi:hypothetical protein
LIEVDLPEGEAQFYGSANRIAADCRKNIFLQQSILLSQQHESLLREDECSEETRNSRLWLYVSIIYPMF